MPDLSIFIIVYEYLSEGLLFGSIWRVQTWTQFLEKCLNHLKSTPFSTAIPSFPCEVLEVVQFFMQCLSYFPRHWGFPLAGGVGVPGAHWRFDSIALLHPEGPKGPLLRVSKNPRLSRDGGGLDITRYYYLFKSFGEENGGIVLNPNRLKRVCVFWQDNWLRLIMILRE